VLGEAGFFAELSEISTPTTPFKEILPIFLMSAGLIGVWYMGILKKTKPQLFTHI